MSTAREYKGSSTDPWNTLTGQRNEEESAKVSKVEGKPEVCGVLKF